MKGLRFSARRRPRWDWWQEIFPGQLVWAGIATRFSIRKTGLVKLRNDVNACEYEDIHVMWEMLNRKESELEPSPKKSSKRNCFKLFKWARCAPFVCKSGL